MAGGGTQALRELGKGGAPAHACPGEAQRGMNRGPPSQRAVESRGSAQPTRAALLAERGMEAPGRAAPNGSPHPGNQGLRESALQQPEEERHG